MASFDPGELNMIMNRGFEGSPQPLIPVYVNRVSAEGITYYKMMQDGQNLLTIGEISAWCAGSLSGTRDIFFSSVVANAPDDPYNGAAGVRVTWWGQDGAGRLNLKIIDKDGNVLPNINYDCWYYKENVVEEYKGMATLTFAWSRHHNQLMFAVKCTSMHIKNTDFNDANAVQWVNGTQWTDNQPFYYWYHQNDSGYYDPDNEVPEIDSGGGGGSWYRPSDSIGFSGLPSLDILSFGMVSMYKMTSAEMQSLAAYLWTDDFFDNIIKNWQDPFQNIINIAFVPMGAEITSSAAIVQIGNKPTGVSGGKLSKSLYEKDFGQINLQELYRNFADYAPYTKLRIYLPGAGVRELNPDDYMDGSLHLKAFIDLFSGTCVYQLMSIRHGRSHIVDHYEANLLTQIPITGANFIDAYKSKINGAMQIASGAVSGNPAPVISGMVEGITAKPSYEKSGGVSGAAMRLSVQSPYIFFDTPQLRQAKNFRELHGYVSNIYAKLGDCTGFTSIKYMDPSGLKAPDTVKDRIISKLTDGVYIK